MSDVTCLTTCAKTSEAFAHSWNYNRSANAMNHLHVRSINARAFCLSYKNSNRIVRNVLYLLSVIGVFRTFIFLVNTSSWEIEQQHLTSFNREDDNDMPQDCSIHAWKDEVVRPAVPREEANCTAAVANRHGRGVQKSLNNVLVTLRARQESELEFVAPGKRQRVAANHNRTRILVRAFPRRKSGFPCFKPEATWKGWNSVQRQPAYRGIFYVKTYKTGSTTMMGVSIRMAIKSAERYNKLHNRSYPACKARFDHWPAYLMNYRNRQRKGSFLFAVLREPTLRAISMFFHLEVSRKGVSPSDLNFKKFLKQKLEAEKSYYRWAWPYDHYLHFLSTKGYTIGSGVEEPRISANAVNQIIKDYDFLGVTERTDESLVALQMMLGLKTSDILYSSAKDIGSWDDQGVYIQPSFVSEGMERFFATDTWKALSKGDYMMYLAANASLDRTIDRLGRPEFDEKLALFRYGMNLVESNCSKIVPYWSAAGKALKTDCLVTDAGCGSSCFDQLERDFNI